MTLLTAAPACGPIVCTTPGGCPVDLSGAVAAINNGIASITRAGDSWVAALDALHRDLIARDLPIAAGYVRDILEDGVAKVGLELRCDVDFAAQRIRSGLSDLKDAIVGAKKDARPTREYPPTVCFPRPDSIAWTLAPQAVAFSGYDFPMTGMTASVVTLNGQVEDVTGALTMQSKYELTLNLSPSGANFPRSCSRVVLGWHGTQVSAVPCLTACPPAPPPRVTPGFHGQQPFTERVTDVLLTGNKLEKDENFDCPDGSHRTALVVTRVSSKGRGNCGESGDASYNNRSPGLTFWQSDDVNNCRFHVHAGIEAGLGNFQQCSYVVQYAKDDVVEQLPAPVVGWCR